LRRSNDINNLKECDINTINSNIAVQDPIKIEKIVSVVAQKLKEYNLNTCEKIQDSFNIISNKIDN
jgi:hypothetical protein